MIQIGEPVGDMTFLRADGSTLHPSEFAGHKLVLIFLRHLA
jgi:hypothetical protein